jgi:hypothetical protein
LDSKTAYFPSSLLTTGCSSQYLLLTPPYLHGLFKARVPQGFILGHLLFSICAYSLSDLIQFHDLKYHELMTPQPASPLRLLPLTQTYTDAN